MSIQGTSATIRREHAARLPTRGPLAAARDDPSWMRVLLILFLITLFIPRSVEVELGVIALTPASIIALVMFPLLLFGVRIKFAWPDFVVVLFFLSTLYSTLSSAEIAVWSVPADDELVRCRVNLADPDHRSSGQLPAKASRLLHTCRKHP